MAFKILKAKGLVGKALIVAPLRPVYKVWPDEVKKWADFADLTYSVLHGGSKEAALAKDVDLYIINPEGLKWLFDPKRKRPQWDVLIIDESTKFKDSTTQRFKALKAFLPSFTRRWILTGTPVPNGLMDLFGQVYILDLGRSLGRFITHYRNQYFTPSGYGGYDWKIRPGAYEEIVEQISPLILQLSAEEYLQMPTLNYRSVEVTLPKTVMKTYEELEKEFVVALSESTELIALNAAAAGTKLRQIANGAVYTKSPDYMGLHDEKLDALESLLEELNGHSVLILYEFDHDRKRICNRLGDIECLTGVSGVRLDRLVDGFNDGTIRHLLGHPGSMGHGLNLQGTCHTVVWYGITWNLEYYDQAIARVYRQGQSSGHVNVYHIIARGTKDEEVMRVLTKKDRGQQDLLSALKRARETVVDAYERQYTLQNSGG
jgi:SNF2 family DNA or RNA helicase